MIRKLNIVAFAALFAFSAGCSSDKDEPEKDGRVAEDTKKEDDTSTDDTNNQSLFIKISSPKAGDEWKVGSEQKITFETNLEDVTISYSTDGGENWKKVTETFDTASPDWPDYKWTVPNEPSDKVIVEVKGYDGDVPTKSDEFKIVE